MRLGGKEIKDECSRCGKILDCELCKRGHGIGQARTDIGAMFQCQMEHKENNNRVIV